MVVRRYQGRLRSGGGAAGVVGAAHAAGSARVVGVVRTRPPRTRPARPGRIAGAAATGGAVGTAGAGGAASTAAGAGAAGVGNAAGATLEGDSEDTGRTSTTGGALPAPARRASVAPVASAATPRTATATRGQREGLDGGKGAGEVIGAVVLDVAGSTTGGRASPGTGSVRDGGSGLASGTAASSAARSSAALA